MANGSCMITFPGEGNGCVRKREGHLASRLRKLYSVHGSRISLRQDEKGWGRGWAGGRCGLGRERRGNGVHRYTGEEQPKVRTFVFSCSSGLRAHGAAHKHSVAPVEGLIYQGHS